MDRVVKITSRMVLKTKWGGGGGAGKSKHLSRQLTGHTRVKLQMRIYSTIFKLSSRQQSFTLRRLWWLGWALCCVHLSSQLFTVMCRDFSLSHYLEKPTKPTNLSRNAGTIAPFTMDLPWEEPCINQDAGNRKSWIKYWRNTVHYTDL